MIYDIKKYKKLYTIEIEDSYKIESVIELNNKDLIFLTQNKNQNENENENENYQILAYRLKDNTYSLFQKVKQWYNEFEEENNFSDGYDYPIFEQSNLIKKLSNNKFLFFSKSENKIYYLNEKNEYEGSILKITDLNLEFFDFKDDSDGY